MGPWPHGSMLPYYSVAMVPWYHGIKEPLYPTVVVWYHGDFHVAPMSGRLVVRRANVWGAVRRCLGGGVSMSGARRAESSRFGGTSSAGPCSCQRGTSQYQLVPAGTNV